MNNSGNDRIVISLFLVMILPIATIYAQQRASAEDVPGAGERGMFQKPVLDVRSMDDPSKEWCYLAKSTTVIGVPFQPGVTSVTYDGALYTGYAEMCFFYGKDNIPLLARQKTFYQGWMPLIEYTWKDGGMEYAIEMFSAALEGRDASNTLNFIRVLVRNTGPKPEDYHFSSAARGKLNDYRFGELKGFSSRNLYEMSSGAFIRDSQLIYSFPPNATREAVPGEIYTQPFRGSDRQINAESLVGIAAFGGRLLPGRTAELIFKMPRVPVSFADTGLTDQIRQADYGHYRKATIEYWREMFDKTTRFEIPEKRIEDAQKASMVHLLLATRTLPDGHESQTDGLPYPMFFLTSAAQTILAYLSNGHPELARLSVLNAIKQQQEDGLYFDRSLAHGGVIPVALGHILYAATAYYLYTRDQATGALIFPSIKKAIGYLEKSMSGDVYGLLPPAYPYDNEMIDGHYTSNNLWALLGLRFAIRVARDMGDTVSATAWEKLEKTYRENILKGIGASAGTDGYVPPGLYPYLTGRKARRGFQEFQTNSDWENMLLAYPTELFPPDDDHVRGTLEHIRKGYAEGIMTYRHGQHLHQYITANMTEQYMVEGRQEQALTDFYNMIVHSGSTHEEFENLVKPWTDRQVAEDCPPPHAWAAAKTAFLIRNFLICEYGGNAGLDESKRDLYLFSVVSPAWAKPGDHIAVIDAPTEMGPVSASMAFMDESAIVKIQSRFRLSPRTIRIRIPYFKELVSFTTDAKRSASKPGYIELSPDVRYVSIKWKELPAAHRATTEKLLLAYRGCNYLAGIDSLGFPVVKTEKPFLLASERAAGKRGRLEPLSFDLVKETFLYEYRRRRKADERNK